MAKIVLLFCAVMLVAGCPARTAVKAAGKVTSTAVRTTGAVVGGAIDVVTFAPVPAPTTSRPAQP